MKLHTQIVKNSISILFCSSGSHIIWSWQFAFHQYRCILRNNASVSRSYEKIIKHMTWMILSLAPVHFVAVLSSACTLLPAPQHGYFIIFVGVNMSCYSWFMFTGQIISFVLIQNLACYSGDPKHVYYNENVDYFHNPYWGANKELRGFARTATISLIWFVVLLVSKQLSRGNGQLMIKCQNWTI